MQKNTLINFVNSELSKDAAKTFKESVMAALEISKDTYYRILKNPGKIKKPAQQIISGLAGKTVNKLFPKTNAKAKLLTKKH